MIRDAFQINNGTRRIRYFEACVQNPPDLEGTVATANVPGTVHVRWDNGSTFGPVSGGDRWEEI